MEEIKNERKHGRMEGREGRNRFDQEFPCPGN